MKRMNKRKALKLHARKRFESRVGIQLSRRLHKNIIDKIQTGRSKHIKTVSNNRTLHDVSIEDKQLRIVYDKQRKMIITVLPMERRYA